MRAIITYARERVKARAWARALVGTRARVKARAWALRGTRARARAWAKAGYVFGPEVMGDFI